MIEMVKASKRFGANIAVAECSAFIGAGTYTLIAGGNGAGKSTLMGMFAGLLRPTAGLVDVSTKDSLLLRHGGNLPDSLTADGCARNFAAVDRERWEAAVSAFGVRTFRDRLTGRLSLGMRQRVAFALAHARDPDLLLLDEPFHGLDRSGIDQAVVALESLARGRTVVHVTHEIHDTLNLATHVAHMESGQLGPVIERENAAVSLDVVAHGDAVGHLRAIGYSVEAIGSSKCRVRTNDASEVARRLIESGIHFESLVPVTIDVGAARHVDEERTDVRT